MLPRTSPDSPMLFEDIPLVPDFSLELVARQAGHWPVAGTDEAG
ncbi:ribonuclease HII, partial [Neorhizobium sp. SHOUNA12B]|nr:ribonuclease HII [Neorhizobium sp. SHOUNA12B]